MCVAMSAFLVLRVWNWVVVTGGGGFDFWRCPQLNRRGVRSVPKAELNNELSTSMKQIDKLLQFCFIFKLQFRLNYPRRKVNKSHDI